MTAMASPSARKVSLLVFVLAISCALLGYQSALLWRSAHAAPTLPAVGLLDAPPLVSNDDDSVAAAPPAWSLPWFSGKRSSGGDSGVGGVGGGGGRGDARAASGDDDDDDAAPDALADNGDDKGDLDDDDSFDDALGKRAPPAPEGWEQRSPVAHNLEVPEAHNALFAVARWSALELRSDDMLTVSDRAPQQRQQQQQQQQQWQAAAATTSDGFVSSLVTKLSSPRAAPLTKPLTAPTHMRNPVNRPPRARPMIAPPTASLRQESNAAAVDAAAKASNGSLSARLDALVVASVAAQQAAEAAGQKKRRGIAFLKTYKCGSSTLGSVLFRYASRHHQRMPRVSHNIKASVASQQLHQPPTQPPEQPGHNNATTPVKANDRAVMCDVALQHIQAAKWRYAFEWYTHSVFRPVFVTVLREPLSHYASWAHFYKLPETSTSTPPLPDPRRTGKPGTTYGFRAEEVAAGLRRIAPPRPLTLDEFVASSLARRSPMAHSIGLYKPSQLPGFVDTFSLIVLTERFDEGLVLLRRLLGWSLIDLTYLRLNDSHQAPKRVGAVGTVASLPSVASSSAGVVNSRGSANRVMSGSSSDGFSPHDGLLRRSWDGLPVTPSPPVASLTLATRQRISELTAQLDAPLYALAVQKFEAQVQAAGPSIRDDLAVFHALQADLQQLCASTTTESTAVALEGAIASGDGGPDKISGPLTRADFSDGGAWTAYLRHGWRRVGPTSASDSPPPGLWACRWYALADLEYEKQIGPRGLAQPVAFSAVVTPEPVS